MSTAALAITVALISSLPATIIGILNWLLTRKIKHVVDGPLTAALSRVADLSGKEVDRDIAARAIVAAQEADMKPAAPFHKKSP